MQKYSLNYIFLYSKKVYKECFNYKLFNTGYFTMEIINDHNKAFHTVDQTILLNKFILYAM